MPAFNAEQTIARAIESVLRQTYSNFEIVVCDDASTDATTNVVRGFSDPRINVIESSVNRGPGPSRDEAISRSKGSWITMLDADDAWDPARLASLMDAVGKDPYVVAFDDILQCHSTAQGMVPWRRLRGSRAFGATGRPIRIGAADFIRSRHMLIQPFFSRELILKSGATHSSHAYGEDGFFLLKLLAHASGLIYVPFALYWYQITPNSASNNVQRMTMLRDALESCLVDFSGQPVVRKALALRVERIRRAELYLPLATALKERRLADALRAAARHPTLVLDFLARGFSDVPYHLHRLYHGGFTRGSK